ncbi:fimbrial protein [Lelliottia nimipressuralis]|uniref:Type 1 fimbrial protein n=1 Tax=Lelliottia nimipressuralis TaxID=69220 RepID=A0ABD4KEB0_9ENTR|nr:fimbrial protein [Lelliottia nimipressuralis]MBF4179900.1 type 1 fimbrial protein [Lelliottia nimipressuralis]
MKGKSSRKNTLISLGLVPLTLFAMSGNASAADSTINITGTVVASPCTIEAVKNVDLGDIDATKLATTGTASTFINFSINMTDCPATTTSATATYSGTASNTDYYANSGTAKNVEVEVASSYSSLPMGNGATQGVNIDAATHAASFNLKARVKNDGKGSAVTPGSVSSAIQVAVQYK